MAAHIDLWVKVSLMSECEITKTFCQINEEASGQGSSIGYISKVLSHRSIQLLADEQTIQPALQLQLLKAIENGNQCLEMYKC